MAFTGFGKQRTIVPYCDPIQRVDSLDLSLNSNHDSSHPLTCRTRRTSVWILGVACVADSEGDVSIASQGEPAENWLTRQNDSGLQPRNFQSQPAKGTGTKKS